VLIIGEKTMVKTVLKSNFRFAGGII